MVMALIEIWVIYGVVGRVMNQLLVGAVLISKTMTLTVELGFVNAKPIFFKTFPVPL